MDALAWLWWLSAGLIGILWRIVWFLVGGWVVTIAQLGVVALALFGYKYGWRAAPRQLLARARWAGQWLWGWLRHRQIVDDQSRMAHAQLPMSQQRPARVRLRQPGDVNLSTLMNWAALAGLALVMLT